MKIMKYNISTKENKYMDLDEEYLENVRICFIKKNNRSVLF